MEIIQKIEHLMKNEPVQEVLLLQGQKKSKTSAQ